MTISLFESIKPLIIESGFGVVAGNEGLKAVNVIPHDASTYG